MKKKCIVMLSGGFGNQLHQLAKGLCFSKEMFTELFVDTSYYNKHFFNYDTKRNYGLDCLVYKSNVKNLIFTSAVLLYFIKKIHVFNYFFEHILKIQFLFDSISPVNKKCNTFIFVYVSGNLESYEKYYSYLSEMLSFNDDILNKVQLYIKDKIGYESVAVHIRRTDYLNWNSVHHVLCKDYFLNGIEYFKNHLTNPIFIFISDDVEWVKDNFDFNNNTNFKIADSFDTFFDFSLLKLTKHVIISNSTFSWWGAFLNNNENKIIIAPSKWLKIDVLDIKKSYPSNWLIRD